MVIAAKQRAKRLRVPFHLSMKDFVIPKYCPIFGVRLYISKGKPGPNSPSLDRIIPEHGYVPGNVVVISHRANFVKNDGSAKEHKLIAAFMDKAQRKLR